MYRKFAILWASFIIIMIMDLITKILIAPILSQSRTEIAQKYRVWQISLDKVDHSYTRKIRPKQLIIVAKIQRRWKLSSLIAFLLSYIWCTVVHCNKNYKPSQYTSTWYICSNFLWWGVLIPKAIVHFTMKR